MIKNSIVKTSQSLDGHRKFFKQFQDISRNSRRNSELNTNFSSKKEKINSRK